MSKTGKQQKNSEDKFEPKREVKMETPLEEYDRIVGAAIKGKDLDISDLLVYLMGRRLIGGALPEPPAGTIESEWNSSWLGMPASQRQRMYRVARQLLNDGLAWNVLRKYIINICGNGVGLKLLVKEGSKTHVHPRSWVAKEVFPNFSGLVRMIIAQTLIHGELYAIHLPVTGSLTGMRPQLRLVRPDLLEEIVLADRWSLTPVVRGYRFRGLEKLKGLQDGIVPADIVTRFVIHEEINDGIHGISLFYQLARELPRYEDWLAQRSFKARADNLALFIRYLKGAKGGKKHELPDRPMIIDAHLDAEKWDVLNFASSSRDAITGDGYEFRLRLAQAVGLPESEVTANAQFAAQMGRNGFPVHLFEYYQHVFDYPLRLMVARTIGCDIENVILEWPRVELRDRSQVVNEVTSLEHDHMISRAEVHRQLGYNHELNEKEIQDEMKEEMGGMSDMGPAPTGSLGNLGNLAGLSLPTTPSPSPTIPTGAEVTLPSSVPPESFAGKLIALGGKSVLGLTVDDITDEIPKLKVVAAGADYGYSLGGAMVFGGLTENGDLIVFGESTFHRVPSEGWAKVLDDVRKRFPELKRVYTGSDEPELTDTLKAHGYEAVAKHIGTARTKILLDAFRKDHRVRIYYKCVELLSDLFPAQVDEIAGMHTSSGGRPDHRDAFRYLFIGLMEESGQMPDIGEPIQE